jgi:flagellar hook-length control protein FliK
VNSLISDAQVLADDLLKDVATMPKEHKMRQPDHAFPLQESSPPDESLTIFPDRAAAVDADLEGKFTEQSAELQIRETTIPQPIADGEENIDQPEAAAKAPGSNENKPPLNQVPITRELVTESVFGQKSSKVTATHIEDIQKTIEMQIEKTPVLGNTVVKILLTPDNIGDIHLQLIKTKDTITAILQVKDVETKGLLEDQLPLLMEPFKHSVSQGPIILTVVADPSLAFSFSEGADPGQRKMERQESRKRTAKEKTETKKQPMTKQSSRGLSLLA